MKKFPKSVIIILALVLTGLAGVYFTAATPSKPTKSPKVIKSTGGKVKGRPKPPRVRKNNPSKTGQVKITATQPKAPLDSDAEEEAKLTAAEKQLLKELQNGLDANSLSRVAKVVEKIQAMRRSGTNGTDPVSPYLRAQAVEALSQFLPHSLGDLIGFMDETDSDILDDVMSHFESAIDDTSLSDIELCDIFKSVAKVLTDEDALDSLFMGIETDMRNSKAVETYLSIIETGSPAAKARVWESIEDFTGEDNIHTAEDLKRWAADPENSDDPDDPDFYGGDKDDTSDDDTPVVTPMKR